MPLLGLKQDLASKIETTPGTAESLSASEGTIQAYDIDGGPEVEFIPRPREDNLGQRVGVTGMRKGRIRFRSQCVGGATDPAWGTVLLPGCGYSTSSSNGTYKPRSEAPGSNVKCLSHGWYQDGRFASIYGSAGNFDIQCESGRPIWILWEWTGLWGGMTSVAVISPTKETALPIAFRSATLTIGGTTLVVGKVNIRSGNNIDVRPDGTAASGGLTALIGSRTPKVIVDPESVLPTVQDHWGNFLSHTTAALNLVCGTSGNRITITAPALQCVNPQVQRRNGVFADLLEFDAIGSSGDDELTIAFD